MAGKKISELPRVQQLLNADVIPVARGDSTVAVPGSTFVTTLSYEAEKKANEYSGRKYKTFVLNPQNHTVIPNDNNTLFVYLGNPLTNPQVNFTLASPPLYFPLGFEMEILNLSPKPLAVNTTNKDQSKGRTTTDTYGYIDGLGNSAIDTYEFKGPTTTIDQYEAIRFTHAQPGVWLKRYVALKEPVEPLTEQQIIALVQNIVEKEINEIDFTKEFLEALNDKRVIKELGELFDEFLDDYDLTPPEPSLPPPLPRILQAPVAASVMRGKTNVFSVSAFSVIGNLAYQWYFNDQPVFGGLNRTYEAQDAGSYSVQVSGSGGIVRTKAVTLSISQPPPPPITVIIPETPPYIPPPPVVKVEVIPLPPAYPLSIPLTFVSISSTNTEFASINSSSVQMETLTGELAYPFNQINLYLSPQFLGADTAVVGGTQAMVRYLYGGTLSNGLSTIMYSGYYRLPRRNLNGIFKHPTVNSNTILSWSTDDNALFSWESASIAKFNNKDLFFKGNQLTQDVYLFEKRSDGLYGPAQNLKGEFTFNSNVIVGETDKMGRFTLRGGRLQVITINVSMLGGSIRYRLNATDNTLEATYDNGGVAQPIVGPASQTLVEYKTTTADGRLTINSSQYRSATTTGTFALPFDVVSTQNMEILIQPPSSLNKSRTGNLETGPMISNNYTTTLNLIDSPYTAAGGTQTGIYSVKITLRD